jgi:nucleoid DNA-binding protein
LNPKKGKDLIPQVAEELGIDETLVKKSIEFYWKSVRTCLEDLEYPDIQIANFGRFVIKENAFNRKLDNYKRYIDDKDKQVEEGYARMLNLKKHIDERNEKKKSFRENKNGDK